MKFTTSTSLNIGDIYQIDNELLISTQTTTNIQTTYLYGKFTEKSEIKFYFKWYRGVKTTV